MYFRQTGREFGLKAGAANRRALHRIVASGAPTGVLAYVGGEPAGWCAVAPREDFSRLARSRVLEPVDDTPVWSVTCFFVGSRFRRHGLNARLLKAAVEYAAKRGANLVEGYPVEPRTDRLPDLFGYHGIASTFRAAGFREVMRRSPTRPIMRRAVRAARPGPRHRTKAAARSRASRSHARPQASRSNPRPRASRSARG